jgi:thymidylate synthase
VNQIDRQYKELLEHILHFGVNKKDRTGTGTKSIFGWQIRHNMKEGFPLLTTKKMAWKTMVTELLWFLRGDTNIKFLVDNGCHIWDGDAYKNYCKYYDSLINSDPPEKLSKEQFIAMIEADDEFAKKWGDLGPIYGKQWRQWQGWISLPDVHPLAKGSLWYDQIGILIQQLKTNPDSRRLMVSAWNVGELDQMVLPPCHYGFQVYTRELSIEERVKEYERRGYIKNIDPLDYAPSRAISLMWNQRSVDTFLGLPFNIASYGLLLEIIANEVNMVPEDLIGNLGDVHLYNNHIEQAKEQITRIPFELPKLNFNDEWWNKPFFEAVKSDNFCKLLLEVDIQLINYQSHPAIKAPLSN